MTGRPVDIKGQRFGRLLALKVIGAGTDRRWKCLCDCGNKAEVRAFDLRSGNKNNCGCMHYIRRSVLNQRFGKLVAVKEYPRVKKRYPWKCVCDCGKTITTFIRYLQRGTKIDCGCGDSERRRLHGLARRKPAAEKAASSMWSDCKANARAKGRKFTLTRGQVRDLIERSCSYCGEPAPSGIDRVDNDRGYEPGNVASCCFPCNHWKKTMSAVMFIQRATKIANHSKFLKVGKS